MASTTLRRLVEHTRNINIQYSNPSVFISQKLSETQSDKVETIVIPYKQSKEWEIPAAREGWVKQSTFFIEDWNFPPMSRKVSKYQRIPHNNKADFQIKPPVKSLFTGIPGPYKGK